MGSSAADRDPRRHASLRDEIVTALREGSLAARRTTATPVPVWCSSVVAPATPS